ncbi:hypothetical protein [Spiroplasma endosymbiont of Apeira syringaria]|uniref:hypothetical protein n=1 Tax=Spiroplasma endosymbiont of Apeira syringaria TaxID=3066307 RepID=UPI0030CBA0FD
MNSFSFIIPSTSTCGEKSEDFLILMGENYLKVLFDKFKEIRERFKNLKNNNKNEYRNYE